MPRKRDGPQPQQTAKGPEQGGVERPTSLPQRKSSRNTSQGRSPSSQSRSRRRQPQGWREFSVRVVTGPDSDAVHALHAYLCAVARRYGLTIAEIDEVYDREKDR